jgi:long-chain acyl-CoA synthetase
VSADEMQSALDSVNPGLPHYKQVRAFRRVSEPFTVDNGLLTANGKLKRNAITERFQAEIEDLYAGKRSNIA